MADLAMENANSYAEEIKYLKSRYYFRSWKSRFVHSWNEKDYEFQGKPSPAQYKAVRHLHSLFPRSFIKKHDLLFYDMVDTNTEQCYVNFLKSISDPKYGEPVSIIFTCGSFWGHRDDVRRDIVQTLNDLASHNVSVRIYTNAKRADLFDPLVPSIRQNVEVVKTRIFIHYILVRYADGKARLLYDYPHTESVIYRLAMLLEEDDIDLLDASHKEQLFSYLDTLIQDARV